MYWILVLPHPAFNRRLKIKKNDYKSLSTSSPHVFVPPFKPRVNTIQKSRVLIVRILTPMLRAYTLFGLKLLEQAYAGAGDRIGLNATPKVEFK